MGIDLSDQLFKGFFNLINFPLKLLAVHFALLFPHSPKSRATSRPAAAPLPLQVPPHAFHPGEFILQFGQPDLKAGLPRSGMGMKDSEDHFGAVDDGQGKAFFDVSGLGTGEVMIENQEVGYAACFIFFGMGKAGLNKSFTDESSGMNFLPSLNIGSQGKDACRIRQACQFRHGVVFGGCIVVQSAIAQKDGAGFFVFLRHSVSAILNNEVFRRHFFRDGELQ